MSPPLWETTRKEIWKKVLEEISEEIRESIPNRVMKGLLAPADPPASGMFTYTTFRCKQLYPHCSNHYLSFCLHSWEVVNSIFLKVKEALALRTRREPCSTKVKTGSVYLYVPFQFFQEILSTFLSHVQLLPFIEEVIVFVCWQVLGLREQQQC